MEEKISGDMFRGVSPALLQALQSRMDPEEVLNAINFFPESAQRFPGKFRCFCPIHREKVIRTMTIDTQKKRFSCRYARCKGSKGGDLLTLYALGTRCSPTEAVDYWVKRLKLDPSQYPASTLPAEQSSEDVYTLEDLIRSEKPPEEALTTEPTPSQEPV
ncbi:MAG TPA: hypothetical protein PKH07_13595, partial [bacterium]|nr:hypothetical protein [bacterium]